MDLKDLDKKQLILLTLLITFVVSIATGIVTVSLMQQMPKSVPQVINNVIQRTIEKVSTEIPTSINSEKNTNIDTIEKNEVSLSGGDALVSIYKINSVSNLPTDTKPGEAKTETAPASDSSVALGQGVIVSDVGLILVDSSILNESNVYKVVLNKIDFNATILKKFNNGFTILKISEKKDSIKISEETKPASNTN